LRAKGGVEIWEKGGECDGANYRNHRYSNFRMGEEIPEQRDSALHIHHQKKIVLRLFKGDSMSLP
jgi:hypothetical protein